MGSSRIIMLSGIYLILGFYTLSFNRIDETNFTRANTGASQIQAEQLARTGVSFALMYMGNNAAITNFSQKTFNSSNSGVVTYAATKLSATQSQIVTTGTFNGKQITITALFYYNGKRWNVERIYTKPA